MDPIASQTITLGSRPSKLAQWQTEYVRGLLQAAWPDLTCRLVTLVTQGDTNLAQPLPEIGGKGVFTAELEAALHAGEIDLAVHSLKDLPVEAAPGLCIGAISRRADARDVLISAGGVTLDQLENGARVGTSSLRRQAQIKALRPDLEILSLRGNVDTRIRKALRGDYAAILLAAAGVERLDLGEHVTQHLPYEVMLPAPGQGALAVQCRAEDARLLALLKPLHDEASARCVGAERAFLAALGGGCSAPVAAYARVDGAELLMDGLVARPDGSQVIRVRARGEEPLALGELLARQALEQGAGALLR